MQKYLRFIEQCVKALLAGVQVTRLRVDAAGCQAAIIDYAFEQNIAFAVRARLSRGLREQIRRLPVSRWQPRMNRAGDDETCCRLVRSTQASKQTVTLVVQHRPKTGQQNLEMEQNGATDSLEHGGYVYRVIAASRDELSDSEIIYWYNQRGGHSQSRIRERECDFAGDRLPCGEDQANELSFGLYALNFNVFALLRHLLPVEWAQSRVPMVRLRLPAAAHCE